jgi:hypothetical protein
MAPLTSEQKRTRTKAWIFLGVAVGIIGLALFFNSPSNKTVDFDINCGQFVVPTEMTLNLNPGQAQISKATLFGFEGSISNAVSGTMKADDAPESRLVNNDVTLLVSPDKSVPVSYLSVTPSGDYGKMELYADRGMVLESKASASEPLSFELKQSNNAQGSAHVVLQSGEARITGRRFIVGKSAPHAVMNRVEMEVNGRPLGTVVELKEGAEHPEQVRAEIAFGQNNGDIELLGDELDKVLTLSKGQLKFTGAFNPDLRMDGLKPKELIADHNVDIVVELLSGKIKSVGLAGPSTKQKSPGLHISGSGEVSSVLQDGRELLPTHVEEVLDKSYTERSVILVILGFLAFVLFKAVDRALDLLLKFFTPEG